MAYFGCINKSSSPPTPPEPDYLYKWDFTKSVDPLVDEIEGVVANLQGDDISTSNEGLTISGNYCRARFEVQFLVKNRTYEIEIGNMSLAYDTLPSYIFFLTRSDTYGMALKTNNGISNWVWYDTGKDAILGIDSSITSFNNSTLKFVCDNSKANIMLNDVKIGEMGIGDLPLARFFIGGRYYKQVNTYYNMTIKSIKIYENEEV